MFLGLDVGTTATKAVVCDHRGRVAASATAAHRIMQPRPGWSEQNPRDWWRAVRKAIGLARAAFPRAVGAVRAIGLTGQMHGSVFLDARDRPLRPAILWNDQRTTEQCTELTRRAGGRATLISRVANPAVTGYTAPKLLWLRDHEPANFAGLRRMLLPKDFIALQLTGIAATDVTDASGTGLFDVRRRAWSDSLLRRLDISPTLLPRVHESTNVIGRLSPRAASRLGLKAGIPVIVGAGDQPAGAVGMGVVRAELASVTVGTSGVVFAHCDKPFANTDGRLQSFCHATPQGWCVFGCMLSAGGSLRWLRDVVYCGNKRGEPVAYERIISEAARAKPVQEPLIFLPYLTGERCPHDDPQARGAWVGLSTLHTRDHLALAVLEGITYGLSEQIDLLRAAGLGIRQVRASGGGAKSAWWRQLMADVFDAEIVTVNTTDGAAYGASLLAAVGAGAFDSVASAARECVRITSRLEPRLAQQAHHQEKRARFAKLYNQLRRESQS